MQFVPISCTTWETHKILVAEVTAGCTTPSHGHLLLWSHKGSICLGLFFPDVGGNAAILESNHPKAQAFPRISSVDYLVPDVYLQERVNPPSTVTTVAVWLCSSERRIGLIQGSSSAAQRRRCLPCHPQAASMRQSLDERQAPEGLYKQGHTDG